MNLKFDPMDHIDKEVLKDVKFFFNQINHRALYKLGYEESYDDFGSPALHEDVEYFHPAILLDDRMYYIAEHIVSSNMSQHNIICNTIISHFYGGRGIHSVATKERDPKKALVDFERMLVDENYKNTIINNLEDAKKYGISIYGSTELRTSLFGSANGYVSEKYNRPRDSHAGNIIQWVAGFIESGLTEKMLNSKSLKEIFSHITTLPGVGSYYGYHCGTSNSVNPAIKINHDEFFCIPGPGARKTLDMLFPNLTNKEFDYGDRVIWFRQNQINLIGKLPLHESTFNMTVNGKNLFDDDQDELKTYGCEVGLCQYGVYHRLKNDPKLANRRKVARVDDTLFEKFINNEKIEIKIKKKKSKKMKEDILDSCELGNSLGIDAVEALNIILTEELNKSKFKDVPKDFKDPFPNHKIKNPDYFKRSNAEKQLVTKIIDATNVISGDNRKGKADTIHKEVVKKVVNSTTYGDFKGDFNTKSLKSKPIKTTNLKTSPEKITLIHDIIIETGLETFGHNDILEVVKKKGGLGLKLDSNWKESWAIMQVMVKEGTLIKEGRKYKFKAK